VNEIRAEIIRKLMHSPGLHFNGLWDKAITSNRFAYHLKVLEEDSILEKKNNGYYLTGGGKRYSAFIDSKSGKRCDYPLECVAVIVIRDNQVLLSKRKREPFYGYWGFPGGKIEFHQYVFEAADRELNEETGFSSKTFSQDKLAFNHNIFIFSGDNPSGDMLKETRETMNRWIRIDEITKLKIFPDVPKLIEIAKSNRFSVVEMNRYLEKEEFSEAFEIIRENQI
jgi:8-oxo-dGTP diphosphatase